MKRVEVISIYSDELGKNVKALSINGETFDWGMEPEDIAKTKEFLSKNCQMKEAIGLSVANHFIECFSEFMGRKVTLAELNEAIKTGQIA